MKFNYVNDPFFSFFKYTVCLILKVKWPVMKEKSFYKKNAGNCRFDIHKTMHKITFYNLNN